MLSWHFVCILFVCLSCFVFLCFVVLSFDSSFLSFRRCSVLSSSHFSLDGSFCVKLELSLRAPKSCSIFIDSRYFANNQFMSHSN